MLFFSYAKPFQFQVNSSKPTVGLEPLVLPKSANELAGRAHKHGPTAEPYNCMERRPEWLFEIIVPKDNASSEPDAALGISQRQGHVRLAHEGGSNRMSGKGPKADVETLSKRRGGEPLVEADSPPITRLTPASAIGLAVRK